MSLRTPTHKITITLKIELLVAAPVFCQICGLEIYRNQKMSIDHRIPRMHGGTDAVENLFPAHQICNCIKGDAMPDDFEREKRERFQHALDNWNMKRADKKIVAAALAHMR